jgi:conjugal transfer mating pair stabilization protein TraG
MEIYTYGNTEAVIGVLHYLVMLFGTDDFMDIVKTCIVIGFIVAACASVMQDDHRGWTWLLSVMLVYAVCFIPKTSVLVTDKLGVEPPAAVASVPWLAGFLFSVKSQIGHTLVQLTETALQTIPNPKYSLPAELSYERHGVAFGNRLIRETRSASLPDTQLRADVIAYIRNCVYPEVGKSLDATAVSKAIPLWPALQVTNPALVTTYTPLAGILAVHPCPDVFSLIRRGCLPRDGDARNARGQRFAWDCARGGRRRCGPGDRSCIRQDCFGRRVHERERHPGSERDDQPLRRHRPGDVIGLV